MRGTEPAAHGLPGHLWTVEKVRQWAADKLGVAAGRGAVRRVLAQAEFTWKKVKELLGKAKPAVRAAS